MNGNMESRISEIVEILGSWPLLDIDSLVRVALSISISREAELKEHLERVTTVEECWDIRRDLPCHTRIEQEVEEKMESLLRLQSEAATTEEEYWKIVRQSPSRSRVGEEALRTILSRATTLEECRDVWTSAAKYNRRTGITQEAEEKIGSLLRPQLEAATTVESCWEIEKQTLLGSRIREEVLRRILSQATNVEVCRELFSHTASPSVLACEVIRKINSFLDEQSA